MKEGFKMEFYKRENNNFNLVKILAAYIVIYAHSFTIQPNGNVDIVTKYFKITHAGQLSVFIFMFLTGIYLCTSLKSSKNLKEFFIKKIMRIYPMLLLMLVLIIGMGAIFTTLPLKEYLTSEATRTYFVDNLLCIRNAHVLPGVFENHPTAAINGSIWYLTFIVRLYLIAGILYSFKIFSSKEKANISIIVLLIWIIASPNSVPILGGNINTFGNPVFPQYVITVLIACLVYLNYSDIKIKWYHILLLLLYKYQVDYSYNNMIIILAIISIMTAVWFGTLDIIKKIKINDYSLTVFLFSWPISQLVCELLPKISPLTNTFLTIIITTILGIVFNETIDKWISKPQKRILNKQVIL